MKALLFVALCATLSGCAVRPRTVYVAEPHERVHHRRDRVVVVERGPREAPPPADLPPPHVHGPGCGHVLVAGVWVNAGLTTGVSGGICAGPICNR